MITDEVRATLAVEGLELSAAEQQLLEDFAEGRLSMSSLLAMIAELLRQERKAA